MHTRFGPLLVAAVSILLVGCGTRRTRVLTPGTSYKSQITTDLSTDWLKAYNALPASSDAERQAKVSRRNQILQEFVWLIDDNYYQFEASFYNSRATFDTAGDILSLALTGSGTVVNGARVKSVLSAIATGTTGAKTSIDKNFFEQQSRAAIASKMRALRAERAATLETGKKSGLADYPLEMGLSDVQDYYYAGTVVGALQAIQKDAGKQSAEAQDNLKKAAQSHQLF